MPESPPRAEKKAAVCPRDPDGPLNLARGWVSFPDTPGAPRLSVELADNPTSRERGLMYVTALPEERGMLFQWPEEEGRTFWMRNTCIPLDMMFIALDGTILGIVEQVPVLNDQPRGIPCPSAQVLEVGAGFARAHGVRPGQHIRLER